MITRGICKHLGCQCVRFPRCCLSANTRPQEKVSRENYEPCLQLSHGRSLYYRQIGSSAAQLWSCCPQPELPFYVLLILFPRLCQSVHSIQNCNQRRRPCKQRLCTARRGVCPLVSGNMYAVLTVTIIVHVCNLVGYSAKCLTSFISDSFAWSWFPKLFSCTGIPVHWPLFHTGQDSCRQRTCPCRLLVFATPGANLWNRNA